MKKTPTESIRIMKKIETQFRQGDVLIERVTTAPRNSKPQAGRPILAHGEATGHAHEVEDASMAILSEPQGEWPIETDSTDAVAMTRLVMKIKGKTAVKHQEHSRVPLERGVYRVTRQREYTPEAIRNVAD